jgi:hypothetical protein
VKIDAGLVEVAAERRPPGRGPKCAVCRQIIPSGEPCIWIRPQRNPQSRFYMHPACSGQVLVGLMQAFNHSNNGGGAGRELVTKSNPIKHGLFEYIGTEVVNG